MQGISGGEAGQSHNASGSEVVRSIERFASLREPWERLRSRVPGFTFFQSHTWLQTWWECLGEGRHPLVACCWRDGELVAAAPMCVSRLPMCPIPTPVLQFAACEQSDYARLLVPGEEPSLAGELWHSLDQARREWRVADLRYVPDDGMGTDEARSQVRGRCLSREQERNRWVDFEGAKWRERVKKPMRHNVERQRRRLEAEAPVAFELAVDSGSAALFLDELVGMHVPQWAARGETSVFALPGYRPWTEAYTRRTLAEGSLYLCRLRHGDRTVAAGMGFVEQGRLLLYQYAYDMAYTPYSPAGVLTMAMMEDVEKRGAAHLLDFGRGDEEYKRRWTDTERTLYRHVLLPDGPRGRLYEALVAQAMPYVWRHPRLGKAVRETRRRLSLLKCAVALRPKR